MPSWVVAKCGARFAFGGKLISFEQSIASDAHNQTAPWRHINISQVITEHELYEKAYELNELLSNTHVLSAAADLCDRRAETSKNDFDRKTWQFLKAHLERKPRSEYTKILGFQFESALEKVKNIVPFDLANKNDDESQVNSNRLNESYGSYQSNRSVGIENGRIDDAENDQSECDDGDDDEVWPSASIALSADLNSNECLLSYLVASGRYEAAVNWCIEKNRWIDALQLALVSGTGFYKEVQRKYFESCNDPMSKIITLIANERWSTLAAAIDLNNWPLAFSFLLNYVPGRELTSYLKILGHRLENENESKFRTSSSFCYICAGLIDGFVRVLTKVIEKRETSMNLHDIIEKAIVLRCSLGGGSQRIVDVGDVFASKLRSYASILVEQGFLTAAFQLLDDLPDETDELMIFRHRLYNACGGLLPVHMKKPKNPFPAPISMDEMINKTRLMNLQRRPSASPGYPGGYQQPAQQWNVPSGGQSFQQTAHQWSGPSPAQNFQQWAPPPPVSSQNFQMQAQQQWGAGQNFQPPAQQWAQPSLSQSFQPPPPQQLTVPSAVRYIPPPPISTAQQTFRPSANQWSSAQATNQPPSTQWNVQSPSLTNNPQQYQYLNNFPPTQNIYGPPSSSVSYDAFVTQQQQVPPPPPVSFAHIPSDLQSHSVSAAKMNRAKYPSGTHHDAHHHLHSMAPYHNSEHQFSAPLPSMSATSNDRQDGHWNDPPPLSPKKKVSGVENVEPLKHPFGSVADQSSQSNQGRSPSVYSDGGAQSTGAADTGNTPTHHPSSISSIPVEEKIPTEHEILLNVLDYLADLILNQASTLQIRRRIEENKHKLDEHLGYQLKNRKLSEVTLSELHQIIYNIQSNNYFGAMQIHTKLAQGRDFDNISSFMPGLKVLLQTAAQLNIIYG